MAVTRDDILQVIEGSLFAPVEYPDDVMRWLDIDGISLRYTPTLSHPFMNMAGVTRLNETNADDTIIAVKEHFDTTGQVVGWLWSELSTPDNFAEHLESKGFEKIATFDGMVRKNLTHNIVANPEVSVRLATEEDKAHVARLYRDAYPIPEEITQGMLGMYEALGAHHYLAYINGHEDPVSVASRFYYPGKSIVVLQGAATLDEFRGQGIYTSLMAHRLDDARADGIEVAVLQADTRTSAPICASLGFEKLIDMALYMYPASEEAH